MIISWWKISRYGEPTAHSDSGTIVPQLEIQEQVQELYLGQQG